MRSDRLCNARKGGPWSSQLTQNQSARRSGCVSIADFVKLVSKTLLERAKEQTIEEHTRSSSTPSSAKLIPIPASLQKLPQDAYRSSLSLADSSRPQRRPAIRRSTLP